MKLSHNINEIMLKIMGSRKEANEREERTNIDWKLLARCAHDMKGQILSAPMRRPKATRML